MNISNIVNQAIENKSTIHVTYKDYNGNITERNLTPLEWSDNSGKFRAFCHLRNAERHFRVTNILDCAPANVPKHPNTRPARLLENEQIIDSSAPHLEIRSLPRSAHKRKNKPQSKKPSQKPFSETTTANHWSRLAHYFRQCLIHENYQQYLVKNNRNSCIFLPVEKSRVQQILAGEAQLTFNTTQSGSVRPIIEFIRHGLKQKNQQLCLGYPIFITNTQQIAPFIFAPLEIEEINNEIRLQAEDYEISYAVLKSLELTEEEIAPILSESSEIQPQPGRSIIETSTNFLISKVSEIINQPIVPQSWDKGIGILQPGQVYNAPCLFWVGNTATTSLIGELAQLTPETNWEKVPHALKEILSHTPEREYPEVPPLENDKNIYVTAINEQQRRAIKAMQSETLTVVTGPPGTGKSQLVLNMISQAILNNQTVLFASRNNKAVDVVMDRLRDELHFPGAVRTGNRINRRKAVEAMSATLNLVTTARVSEPLTTLQEQYYAFKTDAKKNSTVLHKVRELNGLIKSHRTERDALAKRFHPKLLTVAETYSPPYDLQEAEHFLAMLSVLMTTTLKAKHQKADLETKTGSVISEMGGKLLDVLRQFENQWGFFGGGFLKPSSFDSIEELKTYIQMWLVFLSASGIQIEITHLNQSFRELKEYRLRSFESLSPNLQGHVQVLTSTHSVDQLAHLLERAKALKKYALKIAQNNFSIWRKILIWLGILNPSKQLNDELLKLRNALQLTEADNLRNTEIQRLTDECTEITLFLEMCLLQRRIKDNREVHKSETAKLNEATIDLPDSIREDIKKLDIPSLDLTGLHNELIAILKEINTLIQYRDQLTQRVNVKINSNDDDLQMLNTFKDTPIGKDKRLWSLNIPARLSVIEKHLNKWRNLISLWMIDAQLKRLEQESKSLPGEDELLEKLNQIEHRLLELGAQILRRQWLEKVRDLDNVTFQSVTDYVSAVRQLMEPYDPNQYSTLKAIEQKNLVNAIKVFPVWATTNLAAKSNLTLTSELFDIVIIDEASQCDIPSALPLLYRAKKIVVIGDPNQLKHIATLSTETNREAAIEFGIDTSAFDYNSQSLFDITARSTGIRPGKLTLKEHYRSHPEIIGYSNEEFYDNELDIKTDMERRRFPEEYLKAAGGLFWLHVEGVADRPPNGSAFNLVELETVHALVQQLMQQLEQYKIADFNIGVVTPYREQSRRLEARFHENDRVLVGTAHTFQGNERDIMIFSPVLAPGLPDGSLTWLEQMTNLLNVAITRARVTLIIVGNWDFCRNLPQSSKYRRLTDYVSRRPDQPIRNLDEFPLFSGIPFDVIGTLLNPNDKQYNRLTLRQLIVSCRDFVWWMDPYFNTHIFDFFLDAFQDSGTNIQNIRLLTTDKLIEPSERGKPQIDLEKAKTVSHELRSRGVNFEMRLLSKNKLPHDRYFYSPTQSINMPPFGGAYGDHKHISEYTQSKTDLAFFEQFWNQAQRLDDVD